MNPQVWQRRCICIGVGLVVFGIVAATLWSSSQWIHQPFPGFFLYDNGTVSPDFLAGWSGRNAGLKPFDRVLAIGDLPVSSSQEVYDLVKRAPVPSRFQYAIERRGKRFSLIVFSMKFSTLDWLLSFGIYLLVGTAFIAIGIAPIYFGSSTPATIPLFLMTGAVFVWFGTTFDFLTSQLFPKEIRILAFSLTPSAGIHLGLSLTRGERILRYRRLLAIIYGTAIFLAFFYIHTFYGSWDAWLWAVRLGYAYGWFAALIFLVLLWVRLRGPMSQLERLRLRVIGAGAGVGFLLPTSGAILARLADWPLPHNLILVPAVFFPLCVAYALLQYNLFDMDSILKTGLTRVAHTGVLLAMYVLIVFPLSAVTTVDGQSFLVPLLFSVLVILVFNPVLRWVEGVIDRYFYRNDYDRSSLQSEVSALLRTLSEPENVAEKYLQTLTKGMDMEQSCCLFHPGEQRQPVVVCWRNGTIQGIPSVPDWNSRAIRYLEVRKSGIGRDEVESDPGHRDYRAELLRVFDDLDAVLILPMIFEERLVGLVSFGLKRSGMGYTADDFRFLSNLADQLTLALKNGVLFEQSERAKENYQLLYDESEAANRRLVEMDRVKKQFVSNISHELRTPISTILGYAEVLLDRPLQGDEKTILERVVSSGRNLADLMDSLLDFSRFESGSFTNNFQKVDLRDLVRAVETMMEKLIKSRPIGFRGQLDPAVDIVETDGKKLHQILMHLLTNALKFTHQGQIELKIERLSERGSGWIRVSVSDTGIGIPSTCRETIFEEFRQLDGSSTRQYGGTGLGLNLCQKLARSLGATIEVESEVGKGSTFSVILPPREPWSNAVLQPIPR